MSTEIAKILIVEDEPGIAALLRFSLQQAGFALEIVENAADAQNSIEAGLPQLVLLDWMLPDASGLMLLRSWRATARTMSLPVIMLTAKGMDEDKVIGLNAGADDYVTKPFSPRELIARIQALLRRQLRPAGLTLQSYGSISVDADRRLVTVNGQELALDQAEFKLLHFLVSHPDRIFSRAQLLDKVWGDHVFLEERTVDVHIMRLRKSLGMAAGYVKTVRGVGYVLSELART